MQLEKRIANGRRGSLRHQRLQATLLRAIAALLLMWVAVPGRAEAIQTPPLPIITQFDHWDDHWFWWLPHHPRYESIEVAARDPDPNGRRDAWVWLTERAGAKRQIHYRNNPRLLGTPPAVYREFAFETVGVPEQAQSLRLRFIDAENVPIALSMDARAPLLPTTGLTDQSGHSATQVFLIFYRQKQALGVKGEALIGGRNYAFLPEEELRTHRFRWSYSRGIYVGAIPFIDIQGHFGPGGYTAAPGTPGEVSRTLPNGATVSLSSDQKGRLAHYANTLPGGRALSIQFSPGLPACRTTSEGGRSAFRVSLPGLPEALVGEIETQCADAGPIYSWRPKSPGWAVRQPFTSKFMRTTANRFRVSVRPLEVTD